MAARTDRPASPGKRPARGRDATRQGVEPAGAPPTEERNYEDGQDAAFDPAGDSAKDKPVEERR